MPASIALAMVPLPSRMQVEMRYSSASSERGSCRPIGGDDRRVVSSLARCASYSSGVSEGTEDGAGSDMDGKCRRARSRMFLRPRMAQPHYRLDAAPLAGKSQEKVSREEAGEIRRRLCGKIYGWVQGFVSATPYSAVAKSGPWACLMRALAMSKYSVSFSINALKNTRPSINMEM